MKSYKNWRNIIVMTQYINKDKVVAEIERIKKEECPIDTYEGRCKLLWFEQFLSFINTLEVKEKVNTTDAFIEKAKEAFCKATCNGYPPRSTCTSLGTCKEYDNFVKFMRGE